jgi:hypothetical protein
VAKVAGELKNEIMTNKAEILGANGNDRWWSWRQKTRFYDVFRG